jgi:ribosomal protein S18 acetylase RimI-like enzyme
MDWHATIRPIEHEVVDTASELLALQLRAYAQEAELLGAIYFPPLERTVEDIQGCAESFRAALLDGRMVGAVSVRDDEEGLGTNVASLVVDPPFQRRGIGRALLASVVSTHGRGALTVQTGVKNIPALALYREYGFNELRRWQVGREPLELIKLARSAQHAV